MDRQRQIILLKKKKVEISDESDHNELPEKVEGLEVQINEIKENINDRFSQLSNLVKESLNVSLQNDRLSKEMMNIIKDVDLKVKQM